MKLCPGRKRLLVILVAALIAGNLFTSDAFPPAPGFTVYGTVRDPFGWAVDTPGSKVIFKEVGSGDTIAETAIRAGSIDENYRVSLPLDHERSGEAYKEGAIAEATPFLVEVEIDGLVYLPIETVTSPVEGTTAAGFLNLDLNLGVDSDRDGLPDQWEQWQLEGAGFPTTDLWRLDGDGDLDGDGLTNREEYVAGTFAYLFTDNLSLRIKDLGDDGWNTLEFLAVVDKTYVIEESVDSETWTMSEFTVSDDRTDLVSVWKAPDTVRQTVRVHAGHGRTFYRLGVR